MTDKQKIKVSAKVFWEGGLKTRSIIRGFEVDSDEPKSKFGTNTAPAPLEIFISSISSCILSTFIWTIIKARLTIEDCVIDIKAYSDSLGNKEMLSKATITATVWAEKKYQKKIEQCFNLTKKNCSVANLIILPIDYILQFKS